MPVLEKIQDTDQYKEWKDKNKIVFGFQDSTNKEYLGEITVTRGRVHSYSVYGYDSYQNVIGNLCGGGAFFSPPDRAALVIRNIYRDMRFNFIENTKAKTE